MSEKEQEQERTRTRRRQVTPGDDSLGDYPAPEAEEQEQGPGGPPVEDESDEHEDSERAKRIHYDSEGAMIDLLVPLLVGDEERTTLRLRRPSIQDQLNAQKQAKAAGKDVDQQVVAEIRMISNLAEWTPNEVAALDLLDYMTVQAAMRGFLRSASLKKK